MRWWIDCVRTGWIGCRYHDRRLRHHPRSAGEFTLVYLVFNTICNLITQDAQVACFLNAAEHLTPSGSFVIEVGVPALRLLPPGQRAVPFAVENNCWAYDLYRLATTTGDELQLHR